MRLSLKNEGKNINTFTFLIKYETLKRKMHIIRILKDICRLNEEPPKLKMKIKTPYKEEMFEKKTV
jgi:hypothetical protein